MRFPPTPTHENSFNHFDALLLETLVPLAIFVVAQLYSKSVNKFCCKSF